MEPEYRWGGETGASGLPRQHRDFAGDSAPSADRIARTLFDKAFALAALLFFAPFLLVVSLVILCSTGRPVLFAHQRVGRNGRPFECLKFRTMAPDAEARLQGLLDRDPEARAQWESQQKLDDDPRITCTGEFLRRTSLDELPQFWNVLRGDMAIVGPRPIVQEECRRYGKHLEAYLSVKPGITGLWQVSGRSATTYAERVEMDAEYVRTRCFTGDLKIILLTIRTVLTGKGAC